MQIIYTRVLLSKTKKDTLEHILYLYELLQLFWSC
jgi:hypothetical protein